MLKNNPYAAGLTNSTFEATIPDKDLRAAALRSFKTDIKSDEAMVGKFAERVYQN